MRGATPDPAPNTEAPPAAGGAAPPPIEHLPAGDGRGWAAALDILAFHDELRRNSLRVVF